MARHAAPRGTTSHLTGGDANQPLARSDRAGRSRRLGDPSAHWARSRPARPFRSRAGALDRIPSAARDLLCERLLRRRRPQPRHLHGPTPEGAPHISVSQHPILPRARITGRLQPAGLFRPVLEGGSFAEASAWLRGDSPEPSAYGPVRRSVASSRSFSTARGAFGSRRRLGRVCDLSRHQARSDQPERREQKHYDPTQDRQSLPGDGDVHRRRTSDTGRDENRAAGARLAAGQRPRRPAQRNRRRAGRTSRLPAQRGGASPLLPERASRSTAAPRSQRRSGASSVRGLSQRPTR